MAMLCPADSAPKTAAALLNPLLMGSEQAFTVYKQDYRKLGCCWAHKSTPPSYLHQDRCSRMRGCEACPHRRGKTRDASGLTQCFQMWERVPKLETRAFSRGLEQLKCKLKIKMIETAVSAAYAPSCPLGLGSDEKPLIKTEGKTGNVVC